VATQLQATRYGQNGFGAERDEGDRPFNAIVTTTCQAAATQRLS
jgi:hypothetical protein